MIEFRILGPLEVHVDGRPLPLGGMKQRALLATLLLNANEVVSTDRLTENLWGDRPPAEADHSLQVLVSQLRHTFDPDRSASELIVTRPPGYLLRVESEQLDLYRFRRLAEEAHTALSGGDAQSAASLLRSALALWRGPALADLTYESFAQRAVAHLEEHRLAALAERIEADLASGRHAELVGELEELIESYPLSERLRGQLMLALYRAGRQAEALDAYQATRLRLVDELGLEPGPALQRLEKAILRQDPALDLQVRHEAPARAHAAAATRAGPERSILVASLDETGLEELLSLSEPLARSQLTRELILVRIVAGTGRELGRAAEGVHRRRAALVERGVAARAVAYTSQEPGRDLVRLATEQEVDLLLIDGRADLISAGQFPGEVTAVLRDAPCDVGVLVAGGKKSGRGAVMVPFGGAEHDWAAIEIGAWIASASGLVLKVVGTSANANDESRDASRLLASASIVVQRCVGVPAEPLLIDPGATGLLRVARKAHLLVVGLSERWQTEGPGETRSILAHTSPAPVLFVRRSDRPGALAPKEGLTRFSWSLPKRRSAPTARSVQA